MISSDSPQDSSEVRTTTLSRRGCLKTLGFGVLGVGAAGLLGYRYAFHVEPEWLSIERIDVPIAGLPSNFNRFRIVCLSDFHYEPFTQLGYIQRVVRRVNDLKPDLVCLLGDFVFSRAESIRALAPVLAEITAKYGVFAILGNHDLWTNAQLVRSELEAQGIPVLNNQNILLKSGKETIVLAGLDDGWSGRPNLPQSLEGVPPGAPVILMLHEPDFAEDMAIGGRVQLQFSGHSHGGQVRLPFVGAPFLPNYARKYDQGLYQVDGMWLYVTRGIGVISPPGRFNCRPEITEISLVPIDP